MRYLIPSIPKIKFSKYAGAVTLASVLVALSCAPAARAAIAVHDGSLAITHTASATISQSFQVTAGANVAVVMLINKGGGGAGCEPLTLAWNGQTLIQAVTTNNTAGTWRDVTLYYLYNPTPGSGNITGTANRNGTASDVWIQAYSLSGVDTTVAPTFGTAANGGSTTINFTVAGVPANAWAAVGALHSNNGSGGTGDYGVVTVTVGGVASGTVNTGTDKTDGTTIATGGYVSSLTAGANLFTWTVTGGAGAQKQAFVAAIFKASLNGPPALTQQPQSETLYAGRTAAFTVAALGTPPFTYRWQQNGVNLSDGGNIFGSTNTTLLVSNVSVNANYGVVVTGSGGSTNSSLAALTVVPAPTESYARSVLAANPVAFYEFNDTGNPATNAPAFDYAGGFAGTYGTAAINGFGGVSGPTSFPGFANPHYALQTANPAAQSWVTAPAWNLKTNTVTLTAWINPNGPQAAASGIVFTRAGTTPAAGLCYTADKDPNGNFTLGYNWNNDWYTWNWDSRLVAPPGQWSFVALVISPSNAVLYVMNANGLVAATNTYPNVAQAFDGTTLIGDDSLDGGNGTRAFNGVIDDVAVFNSALSKPQLFTLFSTASQVTQYAPLVGAQPLSATLYAGQTAQFTVEAGGTDPVSYQWQAGVTGSGVYTNVSNGPLGDGCVLSGATGATLALSNITAAEAADYIAVVTNANGTATSLPATLTVQAVLGGPLAITMINQEAAGSDWNTAGQWNDGQGGLAASVSALEFPGSTYELLPGARLRSPSGAPGNGVNPPNAIFPGVQLTIDGNGVFTNAPAAGAPSAELRLKQPLLTGCTVTFNKLIMNGGQIDLGSDGFVILAGEMDILTNTALYDDSGGGVNRQLRIDAQLDGTGTILWHGFANSGVNVLTINGPNNTFSGQWNVDQSVLIGTAPNALGTNNIFVSANGGLETTYNIANTNGNLLVASGGQVFLHQNDVFRTAQFGNYALQGGSNYTFATLHTLFTNYFPAAWPTNFMLTNASGSGSMMALQSIPPYMLTDLPAEMVTFTGQTLTLAPTVGGTIPFTYQWKTNGTAILNATNATLTISNVTLAAAGQYQLFVSNAGGATNSVACTVVVYAFPQFTWYPPTPITTAVATLSQPGTVVGAEAFSSVTTVNTVVLPGGNITFKLDGSVATATGAGTGNADFIGYAPSTGDPNFDAVLDGFSNDGGPKTITLKGLTPNVYYSVQLFALDKRNGNGTRRAYFQDPNLTSNVSKTFLMESEASVIGTFIAPGTSQNITMQLPGDLGNANANLGNLNALVIRQLGSFAPQFAGVITVSPSATVAEGTAVTLTSPTVLGPGYIQYQWLKGGNPITGATNTTLVLPSPAAADSGSYSVQVTSLNGFGTATATAVTVTVNPGAPSFVQEPPPTLIGFGSFPVTIPAAVVGSLPIHYQWSYNGTAIPNATSQALTLSSAVAGTYTLGATNSYGGVVSTACLLAVPAPGQFNSIPLPLASGSLNQDVVVERTAQPALPVPNPTTATSDGGIANSGYTWYERGFNTNLPSSGIPPAGSTFVSAGDATNGETHVFMMAPSYKTNDVLMVDPTFTTGTLSVNTIDVYANISLLASTSYGPVTNNWTVNYVDGSTTTGTFVVPDWSGGSAVNVAYTVNGAYSPQGQTFEWFSVSNPRLYQFDLPSAPGTAVAISNIVIAWVGGNALAHETIFAASASTDNLNYTNPLVLTGFNQDMIVEASAAMPERLVGATTATYDAGLGNTGMTLYEQGYNTNAPTTGMPAAGSAITNGNRVFVLAPSWQGPNAAFIDAQNSATLTLATPAPHGILSFLTDAGNGPTTLDYTVNFSDGSTQKGTISALDWFNQSPWAFNANGRVSVDNATFNSVGTGTNCNLFAVDITITNANVGVNINSVNLTYDKAAAGRAFVFALSGSSLISANPDYVTTSVNTPLVIAPLTNDYDPAGFPLTITSITPINGTASISNGTYVVFTPTHGFTGTAEVIYNIANGIGGSASSVINITVSAIVPPTANPDSAATFWNVPVTIAPMANDSDPSGYTLALVSVSPTNGTAVIAGTNVVFTPTQGFVGAATIGYSITNGNGGSASSLITVTVTAPPKPSFTLTTRAGGNLVLAGNGGAPNGVYTVVSSTNAALPLATWTPVLTNTFDATGAFRVTNAIVSPGPNSFFLIKQ